MTLNQLSIKPVSDVVEFEEKYSSAEERYLELADKINKIACFMKYAQNNIKGCATYDLRDKLVANLLEIKNLKKFTPGGADCEELLEHQYKAQDYSGLMFYKCFNSAWKAFVKHDAEKDIEQPFLMIFNGIYKRQAPVLIAEACENANYGEVKYKEHLLRDALKRAVAVTGFPKKNVKHINVLNRKALKELLIDIGAPETFLLEVDNIFDDVHVVRYNCYDDENAEMDRTSSDATSLIDYVHADVIVVNLVNALERLREESKTWRDSAVRTNLTFYFTLRARKYLESGDTRLVIMMKDFVDEDLLSYANKHESDNDVLILSDYTGDMYNTTRKKLRKVEKALSEMVA